MSRVPDRVGIAPPHPGAFIREEEILDELGLSVSEACEGVGRAPRHLVRPHQRQWRRCQQKWRCGSRRAFGVKMETLLHMQAWHDAYAMRQRAGKIEVKPYRPLPAEPH